MSNIPKFLVCNNYVFSPDNLFILCTHKPCMLIRIINPKGAFSLEIEKIYELNGSDPDKALKRANDWYIAYRNNQVNKF